MDPHCPVFAFTWNFESKPFGVVGNRQAVLLRLEVEVALIFVVLGQLLVRVVVGVELYVPDTLHQRVQFALKVDKAGKCEPIFRLGANQLMYQQTVVLFIWY